MVKTPIHPPKKRPHMENIPIVPQERECLISEMKREMKPSRRLRMHITLLASDGRSPTEISAKGWMNWWSSRRAILRRGGRSESSSEWSTTNWRGRRFEVGQVFIYLVELSST